MKPLATARTEDQPIIVPDAEASNAHASEQDAEGSDATMDSELSDGTDSEEDLENANGDQPPARKTRQMTREERKKRTAATASGGVAHKTTKAKAAKK